MGKKKSVFQEYFEAIVFAIILALFIRAFVVQAFKIPSGSMIPTLQIGDHILVNKFIFGVRIPFTDKKIFDSNQPERGDVIVFKYPHDPKVDYIKRVIGVQGDKVELKEGKLHINGELYSDPYAYYQDTGKVDFKAGTVPKGCLFVMGDNRNNSNDSRVWGFVPMNLVVGKAFMIYWSDGSNTHRMQWNWPMKIFDAVVHNRWSRVGDIIPHSL